MRELTFVVLFSACSAQLAGQDWTCWITSLRICGREPVRLECGSDEKTYRNSCEFAKARCAGAKIDVMYYGKCDGRIHTGGPVLTGEEAVLDYFCVELSHENCPTEQELVCGTDDKTYDNLCEYEKSRCTHRDLSVKSFGTCSA